MNTRCPACGHEAIAGHPGCVGPDPYTTPADEYVKLTAAMRARPDQWAPEPEPNEETARKLEERADAEFWCESCDEAVEPTTKYECGGCGNEFGLEEVGSHQCPECSQFASKVGENFCPDCLEEVVEGGLPEAEAKGETV